MSQRMLTLRRCNLLWYQCRIRMRTPRKESPRSLKNLVLAVERVGRGESCGRCVMNQSTLLILFIPQWLWGFDCKYNYNPYIYESTTPISHICKYMFSYYLFHWLVIFHILYTCHLDTLTILNIHSFDTIKQHWSGFFSPYYSHPYLNGHRSCNARERIMYLIIKDIFEKLEHNK